MLLSKNNIAKGLYTIHEPIYHETYFRYPLNSLSSIFYLLPVLYIDLEESYLNMYGALVLILLGPISLFWWALSWDSIKYWDTNFILVTQLWLISVLLDYGYLNIFSLILINLENDNIIRRFIFIFSFILMYYNTSVISNILYLSSCIVKFSDSIYDFPYGTCFFHILSGLAITVYFQNQKIEF